MSTTSDSLKTIFSFWVWQIGTSLIAALCCGLFFGFFTESWLYLPAFFLFWLPALVFASVHALQKKAQLAFNEAPSDLPPTLSLSSAHQTASSDSNLYGESVESLLPKAKAILKEFHSLGLTVQRLNLDDLKRFLNETHQQQTTLQADVLFAEMAKDHSVSLVAADSEGPEGVYQRIVIWANQIAPALKLDCIGAKYNERTRQVSLLIRQNGWLREWTFTHKNGQPSRNFLTHIALLMRKTGFVCHFPTARDQQKIVALPVGIAKAMSAKYQFELKECL